MSSRLFYFNSLERYISFIRGVWLVFIIVMFCISAVSDLGFHCLSMSLLWDTRLIWLRLYSMLKSIVMCKTVG